jgi:adenine-specific DNA-methyltransferase
LTIKGFEIDSNIFKKAQKLFQEHKNVQLHLNDYMYNDWSNKYDGIICNPPYFKFHDYDNKDILKELESKIFYKFNGFTNLYALFLIKSIFQLKENGRAAYIIPSEFLNSDYGKQVKSYLIKNRTLRYIIIINFEESVFDDALTTASILLFANDRNSEGVQIIHVNNLNDLDKIEQQIVAYPNKNEEKAISFSKLNPDIKWRAYYQIQNSINYKNLVPFSFYGKVVRGIATGSNEYFCFNLSKIKAYNIDQKYLLPCLCRAADIKGVFFTKNDFETLKNNNKNVFLLNAIHPLDDSVKRYIQKGVNERINEKYLTSSRNPWYSLENRTPPPIWVSVFNRNGLRFIRNEAQVRNLTTFHCIYLNLYGMSKIDLLFAYLLTDLAKEIFDDNRREYGNGLKKFEPNDINQAKMVNLDLLDTETENRIIDCYNQYRKLEINKEPNLEILNEINNIYINYFS